MSIVDLLQVMMDPSLASKGTSSDVGNNESASVPGYVKFTCSFAIKDVIPPAPQYALTATPAVNPGALIIQTDAVAGDSGMYMSFPQEAVQAKYHFGFVQTGMIGKPRTDASTTGGPSNIVLAPLNPTNVRGISIAHGTAGGPDSRTAHNAPLFGAQVEKPWAFVYQAPLALPRIGERNGFDITPPLDPNYSQVREFAGRMRLQSSTISGGNFNLSGVFAGGIVFDTRDLCQAEGSNGIISAYPVSAIDTQSMDKKSTFTQKSVFDGVVEVTGPDYPRHWTSPDVDKTDTLAGEFIRVAVPKWNQTPYFATPIDVGPNIQDTIQQYVPPDIVHVWVTPWRTQFWTGVNSSVNAQKGNHLTPPTEWWNDVRTQPINEDGVLDIGLELGYNLNTNALNQDRIELELIVTFTHFFAYIDVNSHVQYNLKRETQVHSISSSDNLQAQAISGLPYSRRLFFKSEPRMLRPGFVNPQGGKYLGTYIAVIASTVDGYQSTDPSTTTFTLNIPEAPYVTARARNLDAYGRIGPAHIVRYDQLSTGQTLQMSGSALIKAVMKGKVSEVAGLTNSGSSMLPDQAFNHIASALFQYSPLFYRISLGKKYDNEILPGIGRLTKEEIISQLQQVPAEQRQLAVALGASSGFFRGVKKALVNVGKGALQGALGGLFGGQSGGSYGGNSAGMFGLAGESAGMFGLGDAGGSYSHRQREDDDEEYM